MIELDTRNIIKDCVYPNNIEDIRKVAKSIRDVYSLKRDIDKLPIEKKKVFISNVKAMYETNGLRNNQKNKILDYTVFPLLAYINPLIIIGIFKIIDIFNLLETVGQYFGALVLLVAIIIFSTWIMYNLFKESSKVSSDNLNERFKISQLYHLALSMEKELSE